VEQAHRALRPRAEPLSGARRPGIDHGVLPGASHLPPFTPVQRKSTVSCRIANQSIAGIAPPRAYLRHREILVQSAATHVQRMQKAWSR
jgi:hypothetical protein